MEKNTTKESKNNKNKVVKEKNINKNSNNKVKDIKINDIKVPEKKKSSNKKSISSILNKNLFNTKKERKSFSTTEAIILVVMALLIGFVLGQIINDNNTTIKMNGKTNDKYVQEFVKNYEFILNNYYEKVDKEALVNSAIAGMMNSLDDPYSVYFDEDETDNFSITLDGSYEGIGIQIRKDEDTGYMLVTAVFKDSPAANSGLKVGDYIIAIDDNKAKEMDASEFSSIIKKSDKKIFSIKILRDGKEQELKLNKTKVTLTSVTSEIYKEGNKKIGYIYIGTFANNTYEQFKESLEKLEKEKIDTLILDVRGNTGGHLTAVDSILDLFLGSKHIMYQFDQNGKITSTKGTGNDDKNYEIVLLGDETSASASEVLIAGLKENLNATFIGKKTYGKGTVQELVTLSDGTQYKITIKKWLTPKGNWINDTKGIKPDIEVDLDHKYYETQNTDDDTQLNKALEYIKNS